MESERDTPSSSTPYLAGDRGTGGKFRKPAARKPPRTPYDRPPANQSTELHDGGWLSKLVAPARRLISGSATKILPSFFSKSTSSVTTDLSPSNTDDHDNQDIEATPNVFDNSKHVLKLGVSRSTGEAGPSDTMDRLTDNSENTNCQQDNSRNLCDDSELAKIENLVNGQRFSRDEIDRLTEILNSRVVDMPDAERENKTLSVIPQEPSKVNLLDHENPITSIKGKQCNMERAILETPRPHFQSNMQDEVVASPIDIARAYMGSRTSEIGLGSYSMKSKDERGQQQSDKFASKPFIPTPSPKSSACWPGAMVQDQRGYLTPQTQRDRYGLHNFPRTPYSRTIYSRTKPKTQLQAVSRSPNISSTPFQRSRTRDYGQVMSRRDIMDGGYGSVGPIRRTRNKFATEAPSRGSSFLHSAQKAPSQAEKSGGSRGFLPVSGKNLEAGGTSGTSDYHSVDRIEQASEAVAVLTAPSNQTVRKILEQLDRHKPTPKEKAAELKLATEWKRSPQDSNVMPKESTSSAALATFDLHKKGDLSERKFSVERTDDRGNYKGRPHETDSTNAMTKTSSTVTNDGPIVDDAGAGTSLGLKNTHDIQTNSTDEKAILGSSIKDKDSSHPWSFNNRSNGQDLSRKRPSQHTLKPISFKRPDPQQVVSSDNGRGFTFPFAASTGLASEPPTPSIMPFFPASGTIPQQKDVPTNIPTYNFGTKKSSPRLVFSFPSTSSASVDVDVSDLKFNFGSEKNRLSFGSVGKDAICY